MFTARVSAGRSTRLTISLLGVPSSLGSPSLFVDETLAVGFAYAGKSVKVSLAIDTDDHHGYPDLRGYDRESVKYSAKEFVSEIAHTDGIESVRAVFETRA